ncbi:unnamed protein product [Taenia asiatica]|uniref:RT_RNaseH domain-containing protein n=1 Tax=Taenia asiatica TaxID=60517 RepID=A0A0R3VSI2_TAEAS|nr:unnamed protein product [Taenia asiatica]
MRQKRATEGELFTIYTIARHSKHRLITMLFRVRRDHQALTWLNATKKGSGMASGRAVPQTIRAETDNITVVAEAEPMKMQDAETFASIFFSWWICQHRVLRSIHSDLDPDFESRLYTKLCKTFRISKAREALGQLQGNG